MFFPSFSGFCVCALLFCLGGGVEMFILLSSHVTSLCVLMVAFFLSLLNPTSLLAAAYIWISLICAGVDHSGGGCSHRIHLGLMFAILPSLFVSIWRTFLHKVLGSSLPASKNSDCIAYI